MRNSGTRRSIAVHMAKLASAGVVLFGAVACSSGTARFTDNFYTSAVPGGDGRPPAPVQTPYPGQQPTYGASAPAAPVYQPSAPQVAQPLYKPAAQYAGVDPVSTGSIASTVSRAPLAAPSASTIAKAAPVAAAAAVTAGAVAVSSGVTKTATAATSAVTSAASNVAKPVVQAAKATADAGEGWTKAGGTYVSAREGETVYNLAKRYGVPANAIMEANGISDPRSLAAGQNVLIPVYVYSRTAGVSAPDANPQTAAATSGISGQQMAKIDSAPAPTARPQVSATTTTTATQTASAAVSGGKYTVQSGDTLSAIAKRTGASVDAIRRTNSLSSDNLRIGQNLIIPGQTGDLTPVQTASAAKKAVDPVTTGSVSAADANDKVVPYTPPSASNDTQIAKIDEAEKSPAPSATGISTLRWPAKGRIISAFGSNVGGKANDGIDISMPVGTPVKASENGVVIYSGDGLKEFGKTVLVRHDDGLVTVYGHVSEITVNRGDKVQRGQQIAVSGMSGAAKQPQLHFEVRKNTQPVNPTTYLN